MAGDNLQRHYMRAYPIQDVAYMTTCVEVNCDAKYEGFPCGGMHLVYLL